MKDIKEALTKANAGLQKVKTRRIRMNYSSFR